MKTSRRVLLAIGLVALVLAFVLVFPPGSVYRILGSNTDVLIEPPAGLQEATTCMIYLDSMAPAQVEFFPGEQKYLHQVRDVRGKRIRVVISLHGSNLYALESNLPRWHSELVLKFPSLDEMALLFGPPSH